MFGRRPYLRLLKSQEFQKMTENDRINFYELEHRTMQAEQRARYDARLQKLEYRIRSAELNQRLKIHRRELRVRAIETYFRTIIAAILVAILAVALFVGILKKIPATELAEYVAPISGLAGIAIGYFFGRATEKPTTTSDGSRSKVESGEGPATP